MFNKYQESQADEELVKRPHDEDITKVWLRFFGRTTAHGLPHWRRSKGRFSTKGMVTIEIVTRSHFSDNRGMHSIQHSWLPNVQLNPCHKSKQIKIN